MTTDTAIFYALTGLYQSSTLLDGAQVGWIQIASCKFDTLISGYWFVAIPTQSSSHARL
jgi:hypothetical protein